MGTFTSNDVARIAGVSQSTVSYVLTGKRPISAATRKRVLDAIDELTYQPNAGAQALASQRTRVIGLFVPFAEDHDQSGTMPFLETITKSARAHDHEVLIITADEGSRGLRRLYERSLCDAMILMDLCRVDERVPVAAALGTPVILIGVPEDPQGLYCVDLDYREAARLAVNELADTGHDRVVVIGWGPADMKRELNFIPRFLDGATGAATERDLDYRLVLPAGTDREAIREAVGTALQSGEGARLGIVVPDSEALRAVLYALAWHGAEPGRDVSVIGRCTDIAAASHEPQVTNVSQEPRDVSLQAMETLFWLLEPNGSTRPHKVHLLPPHLTRRETVMPPASPGSG